MRVDLHTHTRCSDGRLSPEELVQKAAEAGLDGLAITDHDSIDAWPEAREAGLKYDIEIIPGSELTVYLEETSLHMLAYFFDPSDERLNQFLGEDRIRRRQRAEAIVDRLHALNIPLSFDAVLEEADGGSICRPHIARAMLEAGYIDSYQEAFVDYIGDDGAAYVSVVGAGPEEAIEVVHAAGGITSIAHPGRHVTEGMLDRLVEAGLDGIEAIHPSHDTLLTEEYLQAARDRDLVVTGGSDYHGYREVEEQRLGYYAVSGQQMAAVRRRVGEMPLTE